MSPTPREVLIEIVATQGEPVLTSPIRCEGLLKDFCEDSRREIFVLVSCLRVGVVDQLRQQNGAPIKTACDRLALRLEKNLALSGNIAKWAVESWAIALGLLDPQAATVNFDNGVANSAPVEEVLSPEAPPPVQEEEELPLETEAPVVEAGPPEFLAREPKPRGTVPDWSRPTQQLTVYPDAGGRKPTLREAVRDAGANARLMLKPGTYKESLVIKRDLQIWADGSQDEVILESLSSSVVVLDGAALFLTGLTLKGIMGKDKMRCRGGVKQPGHLTMNDCDLTSDSSSIVEVKGPESEVILRRCHLHDGKAGGILFQEEAAGYLEECHLYQNKLSHVAFGKGCAPVL